MMSDASRSRSLLTHLALFIIALVIGAASVAPFFFSRHDADPNSGEIRRLIYTHDLGTHVTIMKQFDQSLRSGVLYPRWLPDTNYGYGVATMVYYPPNVFYLCSLIHLFVSDWVDTMFVLSALSVALSGVALYALARLFFSTPASAIAAFLYMLLPYHLIDLYWRGALPEFMGFVFVPLILRFAYRLGSEGKLQHYAAVGLSYGLYVMTHLPVSYLFTYALALYALLWAIKARDGKILLRLGAGIMLGLGVCAIYWLPAALETKAAYEWVSEAFPYHTTYLFTEKLNDFLIVMRKIYFLHLATLAIAIILWLLMKKRVAAPASTGNTDTATTDTANTRAASVQVFLWTTMAVVTTIMPTKLSYPVSVLIPKIQITVPAWRWMLIASAFTSLLVAAALHQVIAAVREESPAASERGALLVRGRRGMVWAGLVMLALVVGANVWLAYADVIKIALKNSTYQPPVAFLDKGWIPAGAALPEALPHTERCIVPTGGNCEVVRWDSEYRSVDVTARTPGYVRLKTYYFPGWVARVNGQPADMRVDPAGAQLISIPAGKTQLEVEFVNTPPRTFGTGISLFSFAIVGGLFVAGFWRGRKKRSATGEAISPPAFESEDAEEEGRENNLAAEHQSGHRRNDNSQGF